MQLILLQNSSKCVIWNKHKGDSKTWQRSHQKKKFSDSVINIGLKITKIAANEAQYNI